MADIFVFVMTTTASGPPCARNLDEFGFAGFRVSSGSIACFANGGNSGLTGVDGQIARNPQDTNQSPSAFLMGAGVSLGDQPATDQARYQYFSVVRAHNVPFGQPQVVVEYFNDTFRHYFNTIEQVEIDALDAGQFAGWTREVGSFIAWPTKTAGPPDAVPVCRFFSSVHASHFYSADAVECDAVLANLPDWQLETREAFWIVLPDTSTGACGNGLMPVYRVFKGTSANHRYVTDRSVRDAMVAAGWIAEGYGPDAAIMCTPS